MRYSAKVCTVILLMGLALSSSACFCETDSEELPLKEDSKAVAPNTVNYVADTVRSLVNMSINLATALTEPLQGD